MPKLLILDAQLNISSSEPGALDLLHRLCAAPAGEPPQIPEIVKEAIRRAVDAWDPTDCTARVIEVPVPELVVRAAFLTGPVSHCIAITVEQMATREHLRSAPARFGLTTREVDVLTMLIRGHTARDIADALGISQNTVKEHVKRVYGKMSVNTRAQAVARLLNWRY